jgi:SAM-dependent methyltransferase
MSSQWAHHVGRAWRESAPFWAKNSDTVRRLFEPITNVLLATARITHGDRVLDVAGGPGEPTMTIAGAVGLAGRVVHTDLALGMAEGARAEAHRRGLDTIQFALASGDALPFADASFDRVVCRLGVAFFPDPERGLAEMLRVSRPGGTVALTVWGAKDRNPFFAIPSMLAARYMPSTDPPGAPDAWRFAEPGLLAGMLEAAGGDAVVERRFAFDVTAPLDFDRFWTVRVELSDTLRERVGALDDATRHALADDVREATSSYFDGDTMRFPAEALVVAAETPTSVEDGSARVRRA